VAEGCGVAILDAVNHFAIDGGHLKKLFVFHFRISFDK
jgi:hypothetical protein